MILKKYILLSFIPRGRSKIHSGRWHKEEREKQASLKELASLVYSKI